MAGALRAELATPLPRFDREKRDRQFGEYITKVRKERGLTQGYVAKALRVDRGYLCGIERGKRGPMQDWSALFRLSKVLEIPFEMLLLEGGIIEPDEHAEGASRALQSLQRETTTKTLVRELNICYTLVLDLCASNVHLDPHVRKALGLVEKRLARLRHLLRI